MPKNPLKGKERELQFRDEVYLATARRLFLEEGYHALTLQRIAEEVGFSKATVYQRFGCKEELMAELGGQCRKELLDVLLKGSAYEGRPRERLIFIAEAIYQYSQVYADNTRIMSAIDAEAVLSKVSEELQSEIAELDVTMFKEIRRPIEEAVEIGDLALPPSIKPDVLAFALWTIVDGWTAALRGSAPLEEIDVPDLFEAVIHNCQMLLDGYGWKPLSSEHDYGRLRTEARAVLLPELKKTLRKALA